MEHYTVIKENTVKAEVHHNNKDVTFFYDGKPQIVVDFDMIRQVFLVIKGLE